MIARTILPVWQPPPTKPMRERVGRKLLIGWGLALAGCSPGEDVPVQTAYDNAAELGEALFHEQSLSLNRTQSCATCHDPEHAFIDSRTNDDGVIAAVSLGDDGTSLGDRNAPTAGYAALTPEFHYGERERHNKQNKHRLYTGALGGQFRDGREPDLEGQAEKPPLGAIEMGMPDEAAVIERVRENQDYVAALIEFFGRDVFDTDDEAYAAMAESIAEFERTELFAPFDSRYDRSLRGEVALTFKELSGKALFFSQFTNCSICHQLYSEGDPINEAQETFTGHEYHNIGVPVNEEVRSQNGVTDPDPGLFNNDEVTDFAERGKFKVPTLRNIAVTEPYMHNGVFRDLKTVIEFYDHYNNPDVRADNPETGEPWRPAETPATVSVELLDVGDPLTDDQVEQLVCFLRALTDQRYEALIPSNGIDCAD